MKARAFFISLVCLWLGAALNLGLSTKISIFGAHPDFLLILLSCMSLFLTRTGAAVLGFSCGLVFGLLSQANLAAYGISRTVVGFIAGWFNDVGFQGSIFVAAITAILVTLLSQLLLMFIAPPPQLIPFLRDTIGTAMYNGVLAMPFYALLNRLLDPPTR